MPDILGQDTNTNQLSDPVMSVCCSLVPYFLTNLNTALLVECQNYTYTSWKLNSRQNIQLEDKRDGNADINTHKGK